MLRERFGEYRTRVRSALTDAFSEAHPPHDVAASFAFGVFVTTLPTLGTGLAVFVAVAYLSDRVSKLALLASVVVLNPVVKWGVYAASLWLGVRILGPVPDATLAEISLATAPGVGRRLLVGNLVLAVVFAVVGYVLALRSVRAFRERDVGLEDVVPVEVE